MTPLPVLASELFLLALQHAVLWVETRSVHCDNLHAVRRLLFDLSRHSCRRSTRRGTDWRQRVVVIDHFDVLALYRQRWRWWWWWLCLWYGLWQCLRCLVCRLRLLELQRACLLLVSLLQPRGIM